MENSVNTEIASIIKGINHSTIVKKVYLFGSHAYGKPNTGSDIDLCVILDDSVTEKKIEILRKIRRLIYDEVSTPVDILLYSESEFLERASLPIVPEYQIMREGVCVYEQ